jgi:hypothetical protein
MEGQIIDDYVADKLIVGRYAEFSSFAGNCPRN